MFLSKILRMRGPEGRRIRDLTIDPLEDHDYPEIRHVVLADGRILAWQGSFESTFQAEEPVDLSPALVCLARDVLDGMVLDLQNRRATRANDLLLELQEDKLRLKALDASLGALIRRTTRGWWAGAASDQHFSDWKYVEFLRGWPKCVTQGQTYRSRIQRLQPGEIAILVEAIPYLHGAELLMKLQPKLSSMVFQMLGGVRQEQIFSEMSRERRGEILEALAPDVTVEFLASLGWEQAAEILPLLGGRRREQVLELLRYPRNVVAGQMSNDFLSFPADLTVAEARRQYGEMCRHFEAFLYLLGPADELVGVLSTAKLFRCEEPDLPLKDLGSPYVNALPADEPVARAAYQVLRSHLPALPVVGRGSKMLGVLTTDAALEAVLPSTLSSQISRVFA